jgi:hypothetical protein
MVEIVEAVEWARSGAMALTGRADGPPLLSAGRPASAIATALARLAELGVDGLPGVELLGERAAVTGLGRSSPFSVGGSFRIWPTRDGWLGLSLARPSDVDLLPALTQSRAAPDPWRTVERWAAASTTAGAVTGGVRLGLPIAAVPSGVPTPRRPGVVIHPGDARRVSVRPLVVDFTALWAGPLCAHVLGLAGARVIKVESAARPDAARTGSPEFFDLLHGGHESVVLDFEADRGLLHALVSRADVVLEASRPRALRQFGIDALAQVERGAIWVSITAYGRADGLRLGFGDDVAAGAGLVAWEDGRPGPAGDALADPLTGITAAAAAVGALLEPRGALLDVSMHDVAVATGPADPIGPNDTTALPSTEANAMPVITVGGVTQTVLGPRRRIPTVAAAPLGAHTVAVRCEFG